MKKLILFALLGGLSLASPAQSTSDSEVRVRANLIELPATPQLMFRGDFGKYAGSYDLANGSTMSLRQVGARMYAQVGDRERQEIVKSASDEFVALDRQLRISLHFDDRGDASGHVLMAVPSRTARAGAIQETRLLSVR